MGAHITIEKMGDRSTEMLHHLQRRPTDEEKALSQLILGGTGTDEYSYVTLDENAMNLISDHIDYFVSHGRYYGKIKRVQLYPHAFKGHDDAFWDKVGQAVENLQNLGTIEISPKHKNDNGADEVSPTPNWEILARILSHVRQRIKISVTCKSTWCTEDSRSLARSIRGHPTITSFTDNYSNMPNESLDTLYSALATLPALESLQLSYKLQPEDEFTLANSKSLTELLRVPSLRSVHFHLFSFTPALCQATANALMEGTAVTKLIFWDCSFSNIECSTFLANGLSSNTSVVSIMVKCDDDSPALLNALATALPSNSTLQDLSFISLSYNVSNGYADWSPIFSALGKNTGLKSLRIESLVSMEESLCAAMHSGLGMNETLKSLHLGTVCQPNVNFTSWRRAFSFLRTNNALKSLVVGVHHASDFCCDLVAVMQDNASLESLTVQSWYGFPRKAGNYLVLVTALQNNRTLKILDLVGQERPTLTHDEDKQTAALLKKNYALESLPGIDLKNKAGDVGAILRLNKAGRRYLIKEGSSISKGIEVLSAVSNEINCVFFHLLENPRLCDRSAVEAPSNSACTDSEGGLTSPNEKARA
jgi:hypothetical protein